MYDDKISAIYFSHKLADSVSIFQKIYAFAPLYDISSFFVTSFNGGLIENCDSNKYDPKLLIDDVEDIKDCDNPKCYICPEPFYKTIKYFNNKGYAIDSKTTHLIDYILTQKSKLY
jgi:hypothetical protein